MVSPKSIRSASPAFALLVGLSLLLGACGILKEGLTFFVDDTKLEIDTAAKKKQSLPPPVDLNKVY